MTFTDYLNNYDAFDPDEFEDDSSVEDIEDISEPDLDADRIERWQQHREQF